MLDRFVQPSRTSAYAPRGRKLLELTKDIRYDLPAGIVVLFVAVPLCLGIALASGAPLFAGLIAGVIGGLVVGALSRSALGVSGPAAGLAVIVYEAIQTLGSFPTFLLAVVIAGIVQFGLGLAKAGVLGYFSTPLGAAAGVSITTIEGLASSEGEALKVAWVAEQVPQCGYCQSGQIMTAESLLRGTPNPSDEEITATMTGNLCRCMAYTRIHKAIKTAASGGEGAA